MEIPLWFVVLITPIVGFLLFLKLLADQQVKKGAEKHSATKKSKDDKEE